LDLDKNRTVDICCKKSWAYQKLQIRAVVLTV